MATHHVRDSAAHTNARHAYYAADIGVFLGADPNAVLGIAAAANNFDLSQPQRDAWVDQLPLLRSALAPYADRGRVFLEYEIPRLGKRVDAVVIIDHVVFVVEFKVGESKFTRADQDQVWDYALDLRNFHESSRRVPLAPILIATKAEAPAVAIAFHPADAAMCLPICVGAGGLARAIEQALVALEGPSLDVDTWEIGRYSPTPTIIEAARALYANHSVENISRSDAGATNLRNTSRTIEQIIADAKRFGRKAICFVTGVPGAGKTLVGLDVATRHRDAESDIHSVFLSGNGPLVAVLREALARDYVARHAMEQPRATKGEARRIVSAFIQNVHHYRDAYLTDLSPPVDHVALFDEAQRAWDRKQTSDFMRRKRKQPGFDKSEPEYLISCLDRHPDWAVVVCLIGGGQEINTGEAGVSEWFSAISSEFPGWEVHVSPQLHSADYGGEEVLAGLRTTHLVVDHPELHLATSMRSFRAEQLSDFVRLVLNREVEASRETLVGLCDRYPIRLTRSLPAAKAWIRQQARGTERYGLVASSQAQRLKPLAVDVRPKINPVHWFLHDRDDTRSSFYLEDVATEFQVQGLELDWACVVWDADLRFTPSGWRHHEFRGSKWIRVQQAERQRYLENAYRVLLTRARQGMVLVVPEGDISDVTRQPSHYDETFAYLTRVGIDLLS